MHNIVIEIRLQPFPKLQGMRIEFRVSGQKVIGPNNGCVAPNIATANVAFLQHSNALEPIFLCQIVGGRQAMPAASDDYNVIGLRRLRIAPMGPPAMVTGQPFGENFQS